MKWTATYRSDGKMSDWEFEAEDWYQALSDADTKYRGHGDQLIQMMVGKREVAKDEPSTVSVRWLENQIKIAADDVTKLRRVDVFRVLSECERIYRNDLGDYIQRHRPEFADDVIDALNNLKGYEVSDDDDEETTNPRAYWQSRGISH